MSEELKFTEADKLRVQEIEQNSFSGVTKIQYDDFLDAVCLHGRHEMEKICEKIMSKYPKLTKELITKWMHKFWM